MDRLKAYSIEKINGRFKKNKHLEWSDISCLFSEIERLRKEKEWLIQKYIEDSDTITAIWCNEDEQKKFLIQEMQQALREQ